MTSTAACSTQPSHEIAKPGGKCRWNHSGATIRKSLLPTDLHPASRGTTVGKSLRDFPISPNFVPNFDMYKPVILLDYEIRELRSDKNFFYRELVLDGREIYIPYTRVVLTFEIREISNGVLSIG